MEAPGRTPPDEITPEPLFWRRREFLKDALLFTATSVGVGAGLLSLIRGGRRAEQTLPTGDLGRLDIASRSPLSTSEPMTPYRDVASYNNFYEFGVDKDEPAALSRGFQSRP